MTIPINTVTKVTKKNLGRDFNFFGKKAVSATAFGGDGYAAGDGYTCDLFITFPTTGIIFNTEGTSATTSIVEYSFNGNTVHGELVPNTATVNGRATLTFYNRRVTAIWFRLKSGSSGPVTVSVEAWACP